MRVIGIITDYGKRDGYAAALLGEMAKIHPGLRVIEITHEVPPHNSLYAAVVLWQALRSFPSDALFLTIVDPEVGSDRSILITERKGQLFVAPDSGVLHFPLLDPTTRVYSLKPELLNTRPYLTTTFSGRDLMAPLVARLALNEIKIEEIASPCTEYHLLHIPLPVFEPYRWQGHIIHCDRFGNLISDLPPPPEDLWASTRVFINDIPVGPIRKAYSEVRQGSLVATVGALETVEVSVNQGSAQERLMIRPGAKLELLLTSTTLPPPLPWLK